MEGFSVEAAPDKPLPREIARYGNRGVGGKPSALSDDVAASISRDIAAGHYMNAAARAAGVSYATIREWIARGEADEAHGLDTPYARFADAISRAEGEAEKRLQRAVEQHSDEDWRAPAFILERRFRDRWGKNDQQQAAAVTINLTAEAATALIEALRCATAKPIEAQATSSEAEPADKR